jgi:methylated-DNA-[protein]-cysteine S-methyltransferase
MRYAHLPSPLGPLLATAGDGGVTGLYFPAHRRGPAVEPGWQEDAAPFADLAAQLAGYFAGTRTAFDVDLAPVGTPFQQAVWDALTAIPHGATTTYGALAATLGRPTAARAVAGAVARNPISIVVPCHRVLGAGGALTGFAGGPDRKRRLLDLEAAAVPAPA